MTAPGSLHYSLHPNTVTEVSGDTENLLDETDDATNLRFYKDGRRNDGLYRLGDAKEALGIPSDHTSEDANILMRIQEAEAIVSFSTNLKLRDTEVEMMFVNTSASMVDALELTESDIKQIKGIWDVDSYGAETKIPKECLKCWRANGRVYVQRTDNKYFRLGVGRVARALLVRGVQPGTERAHMLRSLLNMVVIELSKGIGATSPAGFAANPYYRTITEMIRSQSLNVAAV